jgi:hypothetical protein
MLRFSLVREVESEWNEELGLVTKSGILRREKSKCGFGDVSVRAYTSGLFLRDYFFNLISLIRRAPRNHEVRGQRR